MALLRKGKPAISPTFSFQDTSAQVLVVQDPHMLTAVGVKTLADDLLFTSQEPTSSRR
jgi:hypothetical protein